MLLCINNITNSQLLSPIWSSGVVNAVWRHKHTESSKENRRNESSAKTSSPLCTKIPFLPCYLDRMMPMTSYLSMMSKETAKPIASNPINSFSLILGKRHVINLPFQQYRTFKTKPIEWPKEEVEPQSKSKQTSKEEKIGLSDIHKLLLKQSEKQNEQKNPFNVHRILLWTSVLGAIGLYLLYKNYNKVKFGRSTEETGIKTNITFDDIRGADEVKAELEDVVGFLRDPKKFTDVGAKLPKGILLVGPPGTGKTLLAKAVAGEAGVPFFYASGSEFDELLVGMGALRVRQLFEKARKKAPSIIFLDEIDACGGKRANTTVQPYARQTINQLLQEMDGFTANDTVVVLAATNDADVLDKALVRPGRFDTRVQVLLPDIHGRKEILQLYLDKLSSVATETLNLERLASLSIEMSGADLSNLVNQAALRSIKMNKSAVDQEDLEFALDKVRMGPELKTRIRTEKELRETALHEAGHALVAYYTPAAQNIYKATIMQRGPALGHVSLVPSSEDEHSRSKLKLLAQIDVCMGGKVAEELLLGKDNVSTGASSDLMSATSIAYRMVCSFGMSDKMGPMRYEMEHLSDETKSAVEDEVKAILNSSYEKAKKLLTEKKFEHQLLAEALYRYESLSIDEITLLLESKDIDAVKVKREKEFEQKMMKKLEASIGGIDIGISAPVIDYIPSHKDIDA